MGELKGLLEAAHFAAEKHRHQRRKGQEASPYINHPVEVAWLLAEVGVTDMVTLIAAILHDTLEDTETTRKELERKFGRRVCAIVKEVTDNKRLKKRRRKELQVARAPRLSRPAKLIRIADKTANIRDIIEWPPPWSERKTREYFKFCKAMVDACRDASPALGALFDRTLAEAMKRSASRA